LKEAKAVQPVTDRPQEPFLSPAQQRLVELDLRKPEIEKYYEDLESALAQVAREIGVNGYFKAADGTVYKITVPDGHYVFYKTYGLVRTKREGETKGTLSAKEADAAEAAGQVHTGKPRISYPQGWEEHPTSAPLEFQKVTVQLDTDAIAARIGEFNKKAAHLLDGIFDPAEREAELIKWLDTDEAARKLHVLIEGCGIERLTSTRS